MTHEMRAYGYAPLSPHVNGHPGPPPSNGRTGHGSGATPAMRVGANADGSVGGSVGGAVAEVRA
ncbi:hypothetical protein AB0K60_07335 [Thermopolyspora sp. NPDC052614]|uniref:hypothetical protein n=1 Tax=Thermopolyspora sp. NPDC052614 TaxID=3155682 RepID=UPI00341B831C